MTLNDPIVQAAIAAVAGVAAWLWRKQDRRIHELESRASVLEKQMASHDASKALLDVMYTELKELTKLTNRIAGHLNID